MIAFRKFLDNCAKLIYSCTGKKEYAAAVGKAHEEFEKLRVEAHKTPILAPVAKVEGLTHKLILL